MPSKYLEPSGKGFRQPLDTKQDNGQIVNPPRTNQLGGYDKIKEPMGLFKNKFTISKPGKSIKG